MARKQIIHSLYLTHEPVEILAYNSRRIHAYIYGDYYHTTPVIALGNSSQQALSAASIYLAYVNFIWEGIEPLWGVRPADITDKTAFTIVELIEE